MEVLLDLPRKLVNESVRTAPTVWILKAVFSILENLRQVSSQLKSYQRIWSHSDAINILEKYKIKRRSFVLKLEKLAHLDCLTFAISTRLSATIVVCDLHTKDTTVVHCFFFTTE